MTDHPISWPHRLREWLWPWFPVFAFTIIVIIGAIHFSPLAERADRDECKRMYDEAHTYGDTLVVDAKSPFNELGDGGTKCGDRRRLGELQ